MLVALALYPFIPLLPHRIIHLPSVTVSSVSELTPPTTAQIQYGCLATEHQWVYDSLDPERPFCWATNILRYLAFSLPLGISKN